MRRALFALVALSCLLAARCDPPGPPRGPCGEYRISCPTSLGGGCCWDDERCVRDECVYDGPTTPVRRFGASEDAGTGERRRGGPRLYP